jgi:hypothetical protein
MSASQAYAFIRAYGTPREITVAAAHLAYGRTDAVRAAADAIRARQHGTRHLSAVA